MIQKIKTFLTDDDGISVTDFICIVMVLIYSIVVLGSFIVIVITRSQPLYEQLKTLIDVIAEPVKLIVGAYFIKGVAHDVTNKAFKNANPNNISNNINEKGDA